MSYLAMRDLNGDADYAKEKTEALIKLESLTTAVANLGSLTCKKEGNFVEYDVKGGVGVGCGLMKKQHIAVQDLVFSSGAIFPVHAHKEIEVLVFYEGEARYDLNGEKGTAKYGDVIVIVPDQKHSFFFTQKTRILAVTLPASKDFPDAEKR